MLTKSTQSKQTKWHVVRASLRLIASRKHASLSLSILKKHEELKWPMNFMCDLSYSKPTYDMNFKAQSKCIMFCISL